MTTAKLKISPLDTIVHQYAHNQLLRFTTAGSVDDGKSTLIGRLLYDSKSIFEDQLKMIESSSKQKGYGYIDLSLLTDGLKSEREQGITIDVAYRYFATPKRKFIIADTPGHIQYTRNMVTGASTAQLAIILIDARHGLQEQTHRHSYIATLLQIPHIVVCVNKMDLVDYAQEAYDKIVADYREMTHTLSKSHVPNIHFIPISALVGDHVVTRSARMNWYAGPPLLELLEDIELNDDLHNYIDSRFNVQYIIPPTRRDIFGQLAGNITGGVFRVGDKVVILPQGGMSTIASIFQGNRYVDEAAVPMSVTIKLEDNLSIRRGHTLAKAQNLPTQNTTFNAMICWMNQKKHPLNTPILLQHGSQLIRATITTMHYLVDITTFEHRPGQPSLAMNDIAHVTFQTETPIVFDPYWRNRMTGRCIVIDETTHETVAAVMMEG